ncbi:MAG: hypothetical protein WCX70_00155 [Candidatus Paceibacterota bacterium]|jgi:hypothetical protein
MDEIPINSKFTSRLEAMQKKIDQRKSTKETSGLKSTLLPPKKFIGQTDWDIPIQKAKPEKKTLTSSFLFKVFVFSIIFFVISIAIATYLFFGGFNIISGRNIEIKIQGPSIVRAGDEVNLQATIVNNNKVPLDSVSLIFSYPVGTLNVLDRASVFPVDEQKIGIIDKNQIVNVSSRAIIFGERNSDQEIMVTMEYRLPDSNAIYTKEKIFKFVMGSSPIDLSLNLPEELNAGQEFPLIIKLSSNSETVLKNVSLTLEPPATGFMFKNAEPEPLPGGNIWTLGDIPAGGERIIKVNGILEGQDEDIKSFKVKVGSSPLGGASGDNFEYGEAFASVVIKRSFVNFGLNINGSSRPEVVVRPQGKILINLKWGNNLSDRLLDNKITVKLIGDIIDKYSIISNEGFYNSINNTITWDKTNTPGLSELDPGETGNSSFEFKLVNFNQADILTNPSFEIEAFFEGQRITVGQLSERVTNDSQKLVKIETESIFTAKSVYSLGPLKNSGPVPPRVGQETTYSIVWSVSNTTNNLDEAQIKTNLPAYINWVGMSSPADEKIIYNPNTREVSWQLGKVAAGAGQRESMREAYFQVSITPSLSQLGQLVKLTDIASFQATDSFTKTIITKRNEEVTTELIDDPNFSKDSFVIE